MRQRELRYRSGADRGRRREPEPSPEAETLGEELLASGYRLCCQTYVSGDITISWDPDQTALYPERAMEKLKARWLSGADTD